MRKVVVILILVLVGIFVYSQDSDRVTIVFVSQPKANLYINGSFIFTIGPGGSTSFSFTLGNTYNVYADSDYYIQVGEQLITTSDGKTVVFMDMKPAAWFGVISNVYPVEVFVDGVYYGTIEDEDDMVKIPAGVHEMVLSSAGYEDEKMNLSFAWKEEKYIKVTLKKAKPRFYLILPYSTFSPNGDWDRDELEIKIYASQPATATVLIKDSGGKVYMEKQVLLSAGVNEFKWDGKNAPDGKYILQVSAMGRTQERKITVARKNYTYKKEIILATLGLFSALVIAAFFFLK